MNCTQFRQILADYIAGELAPDQHADAQRHAGECRECACELAGLQSAAAVLDSGRLTDAVAAVRSKAVELSAASPPVPLRDSRRYANFTWLRYAAVIALAFTAGYVLRGTSAGPAPTMPPSVARATAAPNAVIERYNSLADEHPDAPAFTRTLLALAAPARSK